MRRVPPELSDTTIHFFHSFLMTFWKRFHDVPCVKGFSAWNVVYHKLSHELHCFSSFFTNQSQLTGDTSASQTPWSHQTIGAHARQCATALGAVKGMKFFFCVQIIKAGRWFFIVSTSFTISLLSFCSFFWGDSAWKLSWLNMWDPSKLPREEFFTCRKAQMLGEFQRIPLNNWDRCKFLWEILINTGKAVHYEGQGWLPFIKMNRYFPPMLYMVLGTPNIWPFGVASMGRKKPTSLYTQYMCLSWPGRIVGSFSDA